MDDTDQSNYFKGFFEHVMTIDSLEKYDVVHELSVEILLLGPAGYPVLVKFLDAVANMGTVERGIIRTAMIPVKPFRHVTDEVETVYNNLCKILKETNPQIKDKYE